MKLMNLWPVPVMVDQLKLTDAENEELATIAERYVNERMVHWDTGFKHAIPNNMLLLYKSPALLKYFGLVEQYLWHYLRKVPDLGPEDITKPRMHIFGNVERRGQWSIPHAHQGNQLVITYYPKVVKHPDEPHPFAGRLVFHNPKNPQSGFWARKEPLYTPIDNKTGTIVIFPAHAEHSTFPFFCEGSEKYGIVCNVRFTSILEGEDASQQYQYFETLKDVQKS